MRAKPVLVGEIAEALDALLREKAALLAVDLRALLIQPALVYLMVDAPPMVSPHSIVCGLKAHSSSALRRMYKELTTIPTLWTRDYLVAAGEGIRAEDLLAAYLTVHAPQRRPRGRPPCRLSDAGICAPSEPIIREDQSNAEMRELPDPRRPRAHGRAD